MQSKCLKGIFIILGKCLLEFDTIDFKTPEISLKKMQSLTWCFTKQFYYLKTKWVCLCEAYFARA